MEGDILILANEISTEQYEMLKECATKKTTIDKCKRWHIS